jgi:uncharacterized protein YdhG (YjbR/CyaY superfamily)
LQLANRGSNGEELSSDGKKGATENRRERQTLSVRQVPQTKPEAGKDSCTLVLPELHQRRRIASGTRIWHRDHGSWALMRSFEAWTGKPTSAVNMAKAKPSKDIDSYISQFPVDVQAILRTVRKTISQAAPEATETISYQMPAFKQHGILVYFAAWKKHVGLYPPISGDKVLEKAASRYAGPKGNLQFPLDEPIPYDLIERIVKLRVKQDAEKAAAKRKKTPRTSSKPRPSK